MSSSNGPHAVRRIDHVWVPVRDGTRLAARVWLPAMAVGTPVPALIDCHPYRLSDSSMVADSRVSPWFASHGYAVVRVDLRGSGSSEGLLLDEYLPQEQLDGFDVIQWAADQSWCSGAVGYSGISWGGFAGLQVAALRPPALHALITVCASDDRYRDDVHYRGGAVLANDMLPWASTMLMLNSLPPDPAVVGDVWREMWLDRLEHTPPFVEKWLRHPTRDEYWKQGSVCEDYAAIAVPTLAVGGWSDGYVDAVLRLVRNLSAPVRGLIGPWSHALPDDGVPGPAIGYLREALRWWDQWLKGEDCGVLDDPPLRAWMQDWVTPASFVSHRPGSWVTSTGQSGGSVFHRYLSDASLRDEPRPGDAATSQHRASQSSGLGAGAWCPGGLPGEWPGDQREEDGLGLTYTSPPLAEEVVVLGMPEAQIELSSDRPRAHVIVRLCDVAPTGESLLVSRGVLNLVHLGGFDEAVDLVPGEFYRVRVPLKSVAHRFATGHRVRVSITSAYWPWVWPHADPVTLTVRESAETGVTMPLHVDDPTAGEVRFGEPAHAPPIDAEQVRAGSIRRAIERDVVTGETRLEVSRCAPTMRFGEPPLESAFEDRTVFRLVGDDPLSASVRCENRAMRHRTGWDIAVDTVSEMTCTRDDFLVHVTVIAREGSEQVFARTWNLRVPR